MTIVAGITFLTFTESLVLGLHASVEQEHVGFHRGADRQCQSPDFRIKNPVSLSDVLP